MRGELVLAVALGLAAVILGGIDARIVGGEEVDPPFSYPFMAIISMTLFPNFCGGSLVNETYVLTTFHCLLGQLPGALTVELHRHNVREKPGAENAIVRKVRRIHRHPDFKLLRFAPDVALLELDRPVTEVAPIPLDETGQFDRPGDLATVLGWGYYSNDLPLRSPTLQKAQLPIISNEVCQEAMRYVFVGKISETNVCAGYQEGGISPCNFDSGGPLFHEANGKFVQVGVVSWGVQNITQPCGREDKYTVFARISKVSDWIKQTIAGSSSDHPDHS